MKQNINRLPEIRTAGLIEQDAEKELLIYDLRLNKAYHLNETSKIIYRACGEGLSFEELKANHRYSDDLIHFALGELRKNGLLESETENHFAGLSRREAIRKVGLASLAALPVVSVLIAPTAAHAGSVCPPSNQFGIPPGCPAGGNNFGFNTTCAATPSSNLTSSCNSLQGTRCASGSAQYRPDSCVNSGRNIQFSCVCT